MYGFSIAAYLPPVLSIAVGILPVLYFRRNGTLMAIAAVAYFIAILAKLVVQVSFLSFFQHPSIATYLAYGVLTAVFEIGFAYAFVFAFRDAFTPERGWAYGVYLAFYENAIYIGGLGLLSLVLSDLVGLGAQSAAQLTLNSILLIALSAVERIISLIAHAVWGYIALYAALKKKPLHLLLAVPLAFIDSIAVWWDFTHAIGYALLLLILLVYTVGVSLTALYASGMFAEARSGLGRRRMTAG